MRWRKGRERREREEGVGFEMRKRNVEKFDGGRGERSERGGGG